MIEQVRSYQERRSEHFGATSEEEQAIRDRVLVDLIDKVNEIADYLNNKEATKK